MATCVGAEHEQDLGCSHGLWEGCGASEKEREGFLFCGGSLVSMNRDGYPLPRLD